MKRPLKVYQHLHEPEKYPEFSLRPVKAVTRKALEDKIQFSSLRGFPTTDDSIETIKALADMGARPAPAEGSRLIEIEETIAMYVNHFRLGKVLWPVYPTLLAANFNELVDICAAKGLYLYDFWGYVPGSKPSKKSIWGEYAISDETDQYLQKKLGDYFLGYDNGEQDGRYVHALARQTSPLSLDRQDQYVNFQAYFEKLNDAMRNHTVTLASLTFLHYFAREGNTIMIGAETAQALPSSVMWFTFIRGAAKQYGLLYYGNASVWNRWGYKDYLHDDPKPDTSHGYEMGRFAGTSLSLLRRLIYNQYMYNCDILGFEGSWTYTEKADPGETHTENTYIINDKRFVFTPVGIIQQKCGEFVQRHQSPGVLYTPLALINDFHAGWVPPRHLYTTDVYKVWGNLPYNAADYQIHALFSLLFPGYEDAGFYRDERGFLTPTPYGEIADVLLTDVRLPVLQRYDTALLTNGVKLDLELYLKCLSYVAAGGHLVAFVGLLQDTDKLTCHVPDYLSLFGLTELGVPECWTQVLQPDGEEESLLVYTAKKHDQALVKRTDSKGRPLVLETHVGKGKVTLILAQDGLVQNDSPLTDNRPNEPISQPYRWAFFVKETLADIFNELQLIRVDNPVLQYCLASKDAENYTLFVANNTFNSEHFNISSTLGEIKSIQLLEIEDKTEELPEFLPLGFAEMNQPVQTEAGLQIKPGDCQIYQVRTTALPVEQLAESLPRSRNQNLFLSLGYRRGSIKDFLLQQPTFSHHFAGLCVPAEYFIRLDPALAAKEAHYLNLQNISIYVDFTRMINHFPDLSLIGNIEERSVKALATITDVLDKAAHYNCRGAIFSAQRNAENEYTLDEAKKGLQQAFAEISVLCAARSIKFLIQNRPTIIKAAELIDWRDRAADFALALNSANAICELFSFEDVLHKAELILISAPHQDAFGQLYPANKPLAGSKWQERLLEAARLALQNRIPLILSAEYVDWDAVYADLDLLAEKGN